MLDRVAPALLPLLTLLLALPACADDEDIGAAREAICCGANCCSIGSVCATRNEVNPENSCEVCDPSTSRSAWTNICPADAGTTEPADAGTTEPADAGTTDPADAGTTEPSDGGTVVPPPGERDAGSGGEDTEGGCSVGPGHTTAAPALALLVAVGLLLRRRFG